ncbi:MAG TPA: kelch repeat-containing protein [Candidatus Saccharimonadales bacterium]|nr:kelch repeat-containing protein [Candidatus Saccharimonadales bacterium]
MAFTVTANRSTGFSITLGAGLEGTARGQYRNDQRTPIAVGGSTVGDGIANSVWLDAGIYNDTPANATTLHAEVRQTGTGFTGTATVSATARILKEAALITNRRGAAMVYDAKNKRFILFGGYDGTTRYNEVWQLTADSGYHRWSKLNPSGTPPTAKNLAAATYARGTTSGAVDKAYMVIWGGSSPSDLNEMHCLDVSTPGSEAWSAITQTNTPLIRSYLTHHMAGKPTAANTTDLYLFGGWGAARYNDLLRCTFNVNTPTAVTWTTVKANGAVGSPGIRSGCGMIYDSANDRLIITSGYNGTSYLNDVWQFNIGTSAFSQITPGGTAPGGRELSTIAYDSVNQRAILMAGWQGNVSNSRNDIQELNLTSGSEAWTQLQANDLSNQSMLAYSSGAAAVDTNRQMLVVATMNGYDSTVKYTYALDLTDTSNSITVYGLNVIDHFRARDAPATAYNSTRSEVLLINGYGTMDDDATISRGDHIAELWAYNPTANTWRYAAKGPFTMPQNEGGLVVYDSLNDRIIHFGGLCGGSSRTSDVWQFKADAHGMYKATRLSVSGTPPNPRWLMAGCYDDANQRMVLWGGQGVGATVLSDTWALSLTEGSEAWTQLTPTGSGPTAAWQSAYDYDTANKRLYIHGGATNSAGTTFTSQLFYLDLTTTNGAWTNTGVTGGIAARGASLAYDSANQRLVCFGGYDGTAVNNTVRYTSTAAFTSWTTQATANTPAARRSAGRFVVGNTFVIVAGRPVSGTWHSDTQALNYTDAPASWSWTNKAPAIYQVMSVAATGLTIGTDYHWQTWATSDTRTSELVSFGGNAESAADFTVSSGAGGNIKVWNGSAWVAKPMKVWNGSAWVVKPVKRWNGSAWVETSY